MRCDILTIPSQPEREGKREREREERERDELYVSQNAIVFIYYIHVVCMSEDVMVINRDCKKQKAQPIHSGMSVHSICANETTLKAQRGPIET